MPEVSSGGIAFRPEEHESRASMFDLTLSLTERAGAVSGFLQYSTDLFDRPTVQRFTARYAALPFIAMVLVMISGSRFGRAYRQAIAGQSNQVQMRIG